MHENSCVARPWCVMLLMPSEGNSCAEYGPLVCYVVSFVVIAVKNSNSDR